MKSRKSKVDKSLIIFLFLLTSFIILLSFSNIKMFNNKNNTHNSYDNDILGATTNTNEKDFWIIYLSNNPYYYPGWERLKEIAISSNDIELLKMTQAKLMGLKAQ